MSAMDLQLVETDENSTEQIDENLLEPLSEVSFTEREKSYAMSSKVAANNGKDKDKDKEKEKDIDKEKDKEKDPSSLSDSRAKMLHLQRIARSGDSSSNDTVKSSASTKRSKSQPDDNEETVKGEEETVSFSLESIIRRGLNEQKIKSNFNSNFKFGKPDDNISLRCNPTANLFYEHSNESGTDSTSDTYESSGERENTENTPVHTMNNGINENGVSETAPEPRKRGRPRMTEEQKLLRAAEKEALRLQNPNTINNTNSTKPTQVDELMAMGHSMFSEVQPRKRGRPRVKREFNDEFSSFIESTNPVQVNQKKQNETIAMNNGGTEPKVHKKRGRKPKSYHLEMARLNESAPVEQDTSLLSDNEQASTTMPLVTGPKKRGRKPKYLESYYVKLEQTSALAETSKLTTASTTIRDESVEPPVKKKRGRKPKSFYLQQIKSERLNETAPGSLQRSNPNKSTLDIRPTANTSMELDFYAKKRGFLIKKKRGRKPKIYHEQMAALQRANSQNVSLMSNDSAVDSSAKANSSLDASANANDNKPPKERRSVTFNESTISDDRPPAKKRGRKPKSFYEELQRQQLAANQSTPINHSAGSSTSHNYQNAEHGTLNTVTNTTPKDPKPSLQSFIHNRRTYVKRVIPYQRGIPFRRPGIEIPATGFPVKKKRGRKPKNYQPPTEQQNGIAVSNEYSQHQTDENGIGSDPTPEPTDDRFGGLMEALQSQSDVIRMLQQRLSNLMNDDDNDENKDGVNSATNSLPWTNAELCKAFSLQRLNIPLFNHMRKKFSIPLPNEDDVRQFIHNIQFVRGLQPTMLKILECDGQIFKDYERNTILQVSYVKTAEIYEYNEGTDLIWGPHKFLTLIVARGLYKDWSQIVYLNFDARVTKPILISAIEALHRINFSVVATSTSFEEGKNDIFTELSVGYGKNFFPHPITAEKIFCFYYLNDLLKATNAHFCAGNLSLEDTPAQQGGQRSKQPLNKQWVLLAIQNSYRKIPIPRELLAWTDNNYNNVNVVETLFSQYTLNLLQLVVPNERMVKFHVEFLSIMKSFVDNMRSQNVFDVEADTPNFDTLIDYQNKRLHKIHTRLFKLDTSESGKKFRDAMLMSIVSLTMLRKTVMSKYKYPTFSAAAITEEFFKIKLNKIIDKHNFERVMSPMMVFRVLKDIFFGECCATKLEQSVKFFYNGAVTAAEVNGRNETFYVNALIQWLCDEYTKRYPTTNDVKELKRKLKKIEENFCAIQNPNFRICENVVKKMTKKLDEGNNPGAAMNEMIRLYVIQRHLLRIKYFNENRITRIPMPVQMTITLEE